MKPARFLQSTKRWLRSGWVIGAVTAVVGCSQGPAGTSAERDAGRTGGEASGGSGLSGSGGSGGAAPTGGAIGSGGTGGRTSGGAGGAGTAGAGGATFATGRGGTANAGGSNAGGAAGSGGGTGGATSTGGHATGGSAGVTALGGASGSGGRATGGGTATTGGQGAGGRNTGGASGTGGAGTGGSTAAAGGQGGGATGGVFGTGGRATGGTSGSGGASGGATGAGGSTAFAPCPTDGSACKIMPFGDSITDGFGVAGGYRVELFRRAHQAGKNITFVGSQANGPAQVDGVKFPPNHEGHSGYTIDNTGSRTGISPLVGTVMPTYKPHIVLLMIGTNDAIDNYDMGRAPARLGALIDSIFAQLPNILLVVAQPIPSQDDALNQRLQSYNGAIPDVVKARTDTGKHILVVNMYAVLAANPSYKTALLQDTWHPNADGHALIGARWYEVLAGSL